MQNSSPKLKQVEGFTVTGFHIRTKNTDEFNPATAKIPTLWQQFAASDFADQGTVFSVYSDYASDVHDFYTVTVGIAAQKDHDNSVQIKTGNYLVFSGKGPMPETVISTWQQVWQYFESHTEHQRNYVSDFEQYQSADEIEIYIGVKE